jgi:hypothetical protein
VHPILCQGILLFVVRGARRVMLDVGIGLAIVTGVFALLCIGTMTLAAPRCEWPAKADSDNFDVVYGEVRWQWLPPTPKCVWGVNGQGEIVGPPSRELAVRTGRTFPPVFSWFIVITGAGACVAFAVALCPRRVPRATSRVGGEIAS